MLLAFFILERIRFKKKDNIKVLSSTYYESKKEMEDLGFSVHRFISSPKRKIKTAFSLRLFLRTVIIQWHGEFSNYNYLISRKFHIQIEQYLECLENFVRANKYELLFVPNDTNFFERAHIIVFKKLNKPSFLMCHGGMPTISDGIMNNQTDYIVTWGTKQRNAFISSGYSKDKFYVSGHPFYNIKPKKIEFSLKSILVLTKGLCGISPLEKPHLEDRGNAIMYLKMIQNVLTKLNISSVHLRPHPSENIDWYMKHLDQKFFIKDNFTLTDSLKSVTLVIGPISTTIIDAMANERNYIVYEPIIDGKNIMGKPISPILESLDSHVPLARNEEQLFKLIESKKTIDLSVFNEFAPSEYDLSFIKEACKRTK